MATLAGQTVSHYKILEHLGDGGMGVVYRAQDLELDRLVALKFLPQGVGGDPDAQQRFINEARTASALDHPNICTIHEIGRTAEGQLFICMALYEGETVQEKIARGPLNLDDAIEITIQAGQGLARAHSGGMVHRDIKPANVMVTDDGIVKILDFGLAKLAGASKLTREGSTLGTAAYMSPEQARGDEVDARTDIWALGVMLYEMMTGKTPFKGEYDNALIYSILNAPPLPMSALRTDIPAELERIVSKTLVKEPSERYQHVDALCADLRRFRKESEDNIRLSPASPPSTRKRAIPVYRIAVPAALALVILAVVLWSIPGQESPAADRVPIAVITFTNQTGEPAYDYLQAAIPNLLITSLEQSRHIRVITWERMRDVLRQIGKGDVEVIGPELGFELCRHEGIRAIVLGSYVKAGETFATDAKLLDVRTKELLKSVSTRGEGVQSIIIRQIDELSEEIARGVGLSPQKIESSRTHIAEVTTASMEAYTHFLRGRQEVERLRFAEGRESLQEAVALDSTFAAAYFYLATAHRYLREDPEKVYAIRKAKALSMKAPEKERLLIESGYAAFVDRDPARENALFQELVRRYPEEKRFHTYLGISYWSLNMPAEATLEVERALELDPEFALAMNMLGYCYAEQGRVGEAITAFRRYAALAPADGNPYDSMGELYLRLGQLDTALAQYRLALRVQPSFHLAFIALAYVHALREEYGESIRWLDSLQLGTRSPDARGQALAWKSFYLSLTGHERESRRCIARMAEQARSFSDLESLLSLLQCQSALRSGVADSSRHYLHRFMAVYSRTNPRNVATVNAMENILEGLVDASAGKVDSARARLGRARPRLASAERYRNTLMMLAGILEAELLLSEGLADSAVRVYRRTPVPHSAPGMGLQLHLYNIPRLRDVVPRAFVAKGDLDSAIAAYDRLLRINPERNDRRLIDPRLHYRLALVCEQAGRTDRARVEYERFLELWRGADKELPEVKDARRRLTPIAD